MPEQKTKATNASVSAFLDTIPDETKRKDSYAIIDLMKKLTNAEAKMWGTSIIGFGSFHYKYASGHEGDTCIIGFSPRKQNLTLYLLGGFMGQDQLLKKLGKYKTGKGCLYINKLRDVNMEVLEELVNASITATNKQIEKMKEKHAK